MSKLRTTSRVVREIKYPPTTQNYAEELAKHTHIEKISGVVYDRDLTWNVVKVQGDGNCYWRAVALLFYGDEQQWHWVKAQHLEWFYLVLSDPSHPRHALYSSLDLEAWDPVRKTKSLSESLCTADAYTDWRMIQVTADLYDWNICWIFPFTSNRHPASSLPEYDVNSRGCANSAQHFLFFHDNCHWDVVIPDLANTSNRPSDWVYTHLKKEPLFEAYPPGKPLQDKRRADSWRYGSTGGREIPDRLSPVPISYVNSMVSLTVMKRVIRNPFKKAAGSTICPKSSVPKCGTAIGSSGPRYGLPAEPEMTAAVEDIKRRQQPIMSTTRDRMKRLPQQALTVDIEKAKSHEEQATPRFHKPYLFSESTPSSPVSPMSTSMSPINTAVGRMKSHGGSSVRATAQSSAVPPMTTAVSPMTTSMSPMSSMSPINTAVRGMKSHGGSSVRATAQSSAVPPMTTAVTPMSTSMSPINTAVGRMKSHGGSSVSATTQPFAVSPITTAVGEMLQWSGPSSFLATTQPSALSLMTMALGEKKSQEEYETPKLRNPCLISESTLSPAVPAMTTAMGGGRDSHEEQGIPPWKLMSPWPSTSEGQALATTMGG